jgi:glc operon protein GlcG
MDSKALVVLIQDIIAAVAARVPDYVAGAEDYSKNNGNCALCIVDAAGAVYGKLFGTDKIRQRHSFRIAWTKASQVWITGLKTGEYEKRVYAGEIDDDKFGIIRPDFIGWEGGQPIAIDGETKLSVGFSGFRGTSDLEIVQTAVAEVLKRR